MIGLHYFATRLAQRFRATFYPIKLVKPTPIMTRSHSFSRALRQLLVITSGFDWLTVMFMASLIGLSD